MIRKTEPWNRVAKRRVILVFSCALFMLLTSVLPAAAQLVREPYLQLTTSSSVTIVWRTNLTSANNSRVQYGIQAGNLNQTATDTASIPLSNPNVKDHVVRVSGLSPATTYFYNVGTATDGVQGGGTTEHYFVTAPSVGTATPFTAWVVGDGGDGSASQQNVRNAMLAETGANPPDLFLHVGDMAYEDGTDAEFTSNHFGIYEDILRHTPFWPTLGNHEAPSSNTALQTGPYYEAHVLPTNGQAGGVASGTEAYYSFDYANAHFIVLDSMDSNRSPGQAMLNWLQADLSGTAQEWVIVYFHHPPYTKGTHNSDIFADSGGRHVDMREDVIPILEAGGVDLVLGGHSHIYERSYPLAGAYGYGTSPNFATPSFGTLLSNGNILDTGDGDPSGNGAYQDGTVYVVAGHGGKPTGGTGGHPVMFFDELNLGSVLLDVNGSTLTGRNLRSTGVISDLFVIDHSGGGGGDPALTTPTPGSTLDASPVNFAWSAGSGVAEYWLYVGTTPGGKDIYTQSQGAGTSVSVSGIPINGNPVYVRLWWRIGGTWSSTDYTYQTQGGGGGGDPALTTPTPGSTLDASPVNFAWSAGSGVAEYWLYVGTTPGGKDIYTQSQGAGTSVSVSGIPINGNPVYVRLWWRIGGTWSFTDYLYQTTGGGGGGDFTAYNDLSWVAGQLATNITTITSPNGGSVLPSTGQLRDFATGNTTAVTLTVTGGWNEGVVGPTQGADPTTGDAFTIFNGRVTGQGVISYIDQAGSNLILTFTNMDPNKVYDFTFFADRDNYGWDRASLVTISGQDAFLNTSSVATDNPDTGNYPGGVLFTGPTSPSTRLPADNDNGYVARFSNIDPGSDGVVVVTISYDGSTPYRGKYGSAVRLQEE